MRITDDVFAKLVGSYHDRDVLLFEVSGQFISAAETNEWSEPMVFRFVRRKGASVELEFHKLDPDSELWTQRKDPE